MDTASHDRTRCAHCHEQTSDLADVLIVGVGPRTICRDCRERLSSLGLDMRDVAGAASRK